MWHGDTIYFGSDRGPEHRINLYSYSLKTSRSSSSPTSRTIDVEWPSLGPDSIVFENGGYLYTFDLKSQKAKKLDGLSSRRPRPGAPALGQRGPLDDRFRHLPGRQARRHGRARRHLHRARQGRQHPQSHRRRPASARNTPPGRPTARWIAYLSDRSGEDEIYITPQDGMGKENPHHHGRQDVPHAPVWSPDSKKLLCADKDLRLFYVDIDQKKPGADRPGQVRRHHRITSGRRTASGWPTPRQAENINSVINLYSLADKKITPVTTDFNNSYAPIFDPEGKYLYFLSQRDYNEVLGVFDFEFANPKTDARLPGDVARGSAFALRAARAMRPVKKSRRRPPKQQEPDERQARQEKKAQETEEARRKRPKSPQEFPHRPRRDSESRGGPAHPAGQHHAGSRPRRASSTTPRRPSAAFPDRCRAKHPAIHVYDLKERKDEVLLDGAPALCALL